MCRVHVSARGVGTGHARSSLALARNDAARHYVDPIHRVATVRATFLMSEVPQSGEQHRDLGRVGGGDALVVAN
jgi:hypothetical protein